MDSGIRLFRVVYLTVVTILFCTFFFSCQREDLQDDVSEEEKDFFDGPHEGASLNTVLSQEEEVIQLLPSDEDTCPLTIYTEEQLLQLDSIALDLFEGEDAPTRASVAVNRVNSLSGYIVESIAWDSGDWGATHWAGNKIKGGYNARYVQNKNASYSSLLFFMNSIRSGTKGPCFSIHSSSSDSASSPRINLPFISSNSC